MKNIEELFLVDQVMNYFIEVWNWLSGKKTYIAMALLFVYGGLTYLGVDLPWLKDVALWLGGIGLAHAAMKKFN